MKNKNILTAVVSLSLVAVIFVGATLAYFSDTTDSKTNVFTTGNVNITLVDTTEGPKDGDSWTAAENDKKGISYSNVMPGHVLSKNVGVAIDEMSSDCYTAIRVEVTGTNDLSDIVEEISTQAQANGWFVNNDNGVLYCYYGEKLVAGSNEAASVLFDRISVPTTWGNEYANTTFDIQVSAAAVQAANLEAPTAALDTTSVTELAALLNQ